MADFAGGPTLRGLIERMRRRWPAFSISLALACTALPVPASATPQTATATPWSDGILSVVRPLAEGHPAIRDPDEREPGHLLLELGLDALNRASGDPLRATPAQTTTTAQSPPMPALETLCINASCRAEEILQRPELWSRTDAMTADVEGLAALDSAVRRMADARFDREALLFRADASELGQTRFDAHLNATAFAALTRMIDALPAEDPARLEYVALYREMARPLTRLQSEDGWWRETLGDEDALIDPTASALFVFGLAWGLNTGMLSFNEGEAAALGGWEALAGSTDQQIWTTDDAARGALFLAAGQLAERRW
jgi:hypothetical protein